MKNFKEKFDKIKFLMPLIIGILLTLLIIKNSETIKNPILLISSILLFSLVSMRHLWKMNRNKEYMVEIKEDKKKSWHKRIGSTPAVVEIQKLQMLVTLTAIYCLYHFIANLTHGKFSIGLVNIIIICVITYISIRHTMKMDKIPLSFRISSISFVLGMMGIVNFSYIAILEFMGKVQSESAIFTYVLIAISTLMCKPFLKKILSKNKTNNYSK